MVILGFSLRLIGRQTAWFKCLTVFLTTIVAVFIPHSVNMRIISTNTAPFNGVALAAKLLRGFFIGRLKLHWYITYQCLSLFMPQFPTSSVHHFRWVKLHKLFEKTLDGFKFRLFSKVLYVEGSANLYVFQREVVFVD